jgi:hypothetical protein
LPATEKSELTESDVGVVIAPACQVGRCRAGSYRGDVDKAFDADEIVGVALGTMGDRR